MTSDTATPPVFRLFNEIGIINQLTTSLLDEYLPDGLLAPHFAVLNHLIRVGDGRTPLDIARAFQIPKTTTTHQISVLVRHGLVTLAPNPADARSKQVWITAEGRGLREHIIHNFGAAVDQMSSIISEDEVIQLIAPLERIRKHLDQARTPD